VSQDSTLAPVAATMASRSAVIFENLTYSFGTHTAVDGVNLRIEPGETFGLLGPNGAGKTTTIRMLATLLKPASGSITVFGVDAASHPMQTRRMIGYVPQLLSADATLTGRKMFTCSPGSSTSRATAARAGWTPRSPRWASPMPPRGWSRRFRVA